MQHINAWEIIVFFLLMNLTLVVFRTKGDLPTFIAALNSIGSQTVALIVLVVGCVMLVVCKLYGLDSTIAGGIIGVASNMLTNIFKESHTTNAGGTQTNVGSPISPKA